MPRRRLGKQAVDSECQPIRPHHSNLKTLQAGQNHQTAEDPKTYEE